MPGALYLIPVALGDSGWSDVLPQRSRDIACRLRHFVVENAKTARAELNRIGHPGPMRDLWIEELPSQPSAMDIDRLMAPLQENHDLGVMSEAGCPGIADPGSHLVLKAHQTGIRVIPLVGPSSILLALMASGMNGQDFAFRGYLPSRDPERAGTISRIEFESRNNHQTQIFIETPYRNDALLTALLKTCKGATRVCIASNLTLDDEVVISRSVAEWQRHPLPSLHHRPTIFLLNAS